MALSAADVWEVRATGSDNNGGGFKAGAAGTDRSQQDAAQVAIDNAAITTSITTNVITFTAGYTPTAADVGNVVQMLTGTNVTAGFYEITAQTATTWTVDRNVVTAGTTTNATGNMGGALASPGKAASAKVASNTVFVKYSATAYTCSATANVAGGRVNDTASASLAAPNYWVGYDTTRTVGNTDANRPTLDAGAASMTVCTFAGQYTHVANLVVTNSAARASVFGVDVTASAPNWVRDVKVSGATNVGLALRNCGILARCVATGCSATGGLYVAGTGSLLLGCVATACSAAPFNLTVACTVVDCVAYANTTGGFSAGGGQTWLVNCVSQGNTGASSDGYALGGQICTLVNCVAYGNGGYGYNTSTVGGFNRLVNCSAGGNTSGDTHANFSSTQKVGFISLSADPFTASGSQDFGLNNTAGGGASLRAAAYPASLPGLSTSNYLDVGAAQHQDSAPAASGFVVRRTLNSSGMPLPAAAW